MRPERAARSRGKTRRLAGAEATAKGRARRAYHRVRLHFFCYQIPSNTTTHLEQHFSQWFWNLDGRDILGWSWQIKKVVQGLKYHRFRKALG